MAVLEIVYLEVVLMRTIISTITLICDLTLMSFPLFQGESVIFKQLSWEQLEDEDWEKVRFFSFKSSLFGPYISGSDISANQG
jgi:hypothetical protein